MRSRIEGLGDEVPFDTDDLPLGLDSMIDWDEVTQVPWCVSEIEIEIEIKKPKSR